MTALTNSGSGTIKSTTLEAAFVEIVQLAQDFEDAAISDGDLTTNNIALDFLTGQKLTTITVTLPATFVSGAGGSVTVAAEDYFNDIPGYVLPTLTGPTFAGTHYAAVILELATEMQALETTDNFVTSTFNFDTKTVAIAAQLPTVFSVGPTGAIVATVTPYLP